MSAQIQLDFFYETTQEDIQKAEINSLKESLRATQKKAFAEIRTLSKMVVEQQERLDFLMIKLNLACPLEKAQS
jgi:hypothetical protein